MPPDLKRILRSVTHRRILGFFLENQGSIDTAKGVSTWTGERLEKVRAALEDLARRGVLKAHRTSSTVGYSCALKKKTLSALSSEIRHEKEA